MKLLPTLPVVLAIGCVPFDNSGALDNGAQPPGTDLTIDFSRRNAQVLQLAGDYAYVDLAGLRRCQLTSGCNTFEALSTRTSHIYPTSDTTLWLNAPVELIVMRPEGPKLMQGPESPCDLFAASRTGAFCRTLLGKELHYAYNPLTQALETHVFKDIEDLRSMPDEKAVAYERHMLIAETPQGGQRRVYVRAMDRTGELHSWSVDNEVKQLGLNNVVAAWADVNHVAYRADLRTGQVSKLGPIGILTVADDGIYYRPASDIKGTIMRLPNDGSPARMVAQSPAWDQAEQLHVYQGRIYAVRGDTIVGGALLP